MGSGIRDGARAAIGACGRAALICGMECMRKVFCCCGCVPRPNELKQKLGQIGGAKVEAEFHQGTGTTTSRMTGGFLPSQAGGPGTCGYTTLEFLFTAVKSLRYDTEADLQAWWEAAREGGEEFGNRQIRGQLGQWDSTFFPKDEVEREVDKMKPRERPKVEGAQEGEGGESSPGRGAEKCEKLEPYSIRFEVKRIPHSIGVTPWPPGVDEPPELLIMEPNFGVIRIPATALEQTLEFIKEDFYTGMRCTLESDPERFIKIGVWGQLDFRLLGRGDGSAVSGLHEVEGGISEASYGIYDRLLPDSPGDGGKAQDDNTNLPRPKH